MDDEISFEIKQGDIILENVWMRYDDKLPYALKGISLVIEAGKKYGIIGRTGAGKSSLFQVLFKMVEI